MRSIVNKLELNGRRTQRRPSCVYSGTWTYLKDPEGQEIELYAESPEDGAMGIAEGLPFARRADGRPSDGRAPLDLDALFRELKPGDALDAPIPPHTRIGHVHLYVRNVPEAVRRSLLRRIERKARVKR